jgi:hypothetical protein
MENVPIDGAGEIQRLFIAKDAIACFQTGCYTPGYKRND